MDFIDLKKQYKIIKNEIDANIATVLEHGQYIMGPEVSVLEKKLGEYTKSKYVITCSSGTDALLMALMALDVKPGDYVLTTPFTYIATAEVISLLGAIPEFVDVDPNTFNIDMSLLEKKFRSNPEKYKVIISVNIFGLTANYEELNKLKEEYNFKIIEDAAQSFGANINGQMSCTFGDISCTSFFPAKPLGCYGDGGAIFTNNQSYNEIMKSIRIHGQGKDKYDNIRLGINGRLDTIQAAILIPKLEILNQEIRSRNKIAKYYNSKLNEQFKSQSIPSGYVSAWAQYSFLCDSNSQRDEIILKLKENNIPSAIYYLTPLHIQKVFKALGYKIGDFPIAEDVSNRILSLPMHPYLSEQDIDSICNTIMEKSIHGI